MNFDIDKELTESSAWKEAFRQGRVIAKKEVLRQVNLLTKLGNPLHLAVVFVSSTHIYGELSRIAPPHVAAVLLPAWLYHLTAFLFTVLIDAVAVYTLRSRSSAFYVGGSIKKTVEGEFPSHWFFYLLTAILNGAFVTSYTPEMPALWQGVSLWLRSLLMVCLVVLVPLSLIEIEKAKHRAEIIRLTLLAEVAALNALQIHEEQKEEKPQAVEVAVEAAPLATTRLVTASLAKRTIPCEVCHEEMSITDRGVAGRKKWRDRFGGKYACRNCRDKLGV